MSKRDNGFELYVVDQSKRVSDCFMLYYSIRI